jgi:hypothetical protein
MSIYKDKQSHILKRNSTPQTQDATGVLIKTNVERQEYLS